VPILIRRFIWEDFGWCNLVLPAIYIQIVDMARERLGLNYCIGEQIGNPMLGVSAI